MGMNNVLQSNSSMHHYECVVLCKDNSLQRGRSYARSLASCILRSSKDRWTFFIQVCVAAPVVNCNRMLHSTNYNIILTSEIFCVYSTLPVSPQSRVLCSRYFAFAMPLLLPKQQCSSTKSTQKWNVKATESSKVGCSSPAVKPWVSQ